MCEWVDDLRDWIWLETIRPDKESIGKDKLTWDICNPQQWTQQRMNVNSYKMEMFDVSIHIGHLGLSILIQNTQTRDKFFTMLSITVLFIEECKSKQSI